MEKIQKIQLIEKQSNERNNLIQQRYCKSIHHLQAQQYRELIFSKKKRIPKESMIFLELEEAEKELIKNQKTEKSNIEQIQKNEKKKLETAHRRMLDSLKLKYDKRIIDADYKQKQDSLRISSMYDILVRRLKHNMEDNDPALEEMLKQREAVLQQLQEECETLKTNLKLDSGN